MPSSLFPLLLAVHIALAVALVLPSIVLPFALRAEGARAGTRAPRAKGPGARSAERSADGAGGADGAGNAAAAAGEAGRLVRVLLFLQAHGTLVIGTGLALTGAGLVAILGGQLLAQPWLLVALAFYAVNLVLAFFVQRPNLRRLLGWRGGDETAWRARARRQRYVSYTMAGLVGVIGFLMSAKPDLW
jgi:hypothetical protein